MKKNFSNILILLIFFPCVVLSNECRHEDSIGLFVDEVEVKVTIWISGSECESSNFKIGVHTKKSKPLYISESFVGNYLGGETLGLNRDKVKPLISEFLNDFAQPIPIRLLKTYERCLLWVPDEYIEKLISLDSVMYSHKLRARETRYISYIPEIDQMVVVAQCANR